MGRGSRTAKQASQSVGQPGGDMLEGGLVIRAVLCRATMICPLCHCLTQSWDADCLGEDMISGEATLFS